MLQYVIAGLVLGGIYALAASGLIVTYVSSGVLNFAFGSLAYLVARTNYWLHVEQGWAVAPAAFVSVFVAAPALGLFLYVVLFRSLQGASSLIKVVVTIGLSVTIPPVANLVFGLTEIIRAPGLAPEPVRVFRVLDTAVTMDQVIVYASVLAIMVTGAVVLRYTDTGLNVRATVDSAAMTSLSGSNPASVAMGATVVSTFLAGLAGVLAAPIIGLTAGDYTLLVAAAFAAVIAARLRSLPVAIASAFAMGVAGALAQYFLPAASTLRAAVLPSIPFIFIVVFLAYHLIRSGQVSESAGNGSDLDRAIAAHGGHGAPGTPEGGVQQGAPVHPFGSVSMFVLVALLPLVLAPYWLGLMGQAAAFAVALLSYTLVTGEGGMLWLSQITFVGVGAVATAQLATVHGWPLPLAVLTAALIAAGLGVAVGLATIRLGDLYVALVTLTFGLLMERLVFTLSNFLRFGVGAPLERPSWIADDRAFAFFALAVFAVVAVLIVNVRRSTTGMALTAVRTSAGRVADDRARRGIAQGVVRRSGCLRRQHRWLSVGSARRGCAALELLGAARDGLADRDRDVRRPIERGRAARGAELHLRAGTVPHLPHAGVVATDSDPVRVRRHDGGPPSRGRRAGGRTQPGPPRDHRGLVPPRPPARAPGHEGVRRAHARRLRALTARWQGRPGDREHRRWISSGPGGDSRQTLRTWTARRSIGEGSGSSRRPHRPRRRSRGRARRSCARTHRSTDR